MLQADPCSLLDPVQSERANRFLELARDFDGQGGRVTDQSRCEARLSLTLESRGLLSGPVTRPPIGEAEDGFGQVWDFKAPHSRAAIAHRAAQKAAIGGYPPPEIPEDGYRGEFDLVTELDRAYGQQTIGKGVVFDVRRLTAAQGLDLIDAVDNDSRLDPALIRFFPPPDDVAAFSGGARVDAV
jgi:hypothetical protein